MSLPKLEKDRNTVEENLEEVAKLLERMGQVRPEFADLAESVRTAMGRINNVPTRFANVPTQFAKVFDDEMMSRALCDAIDLAVAADPTNHLFDRLKKVANRTP